MIIYETEWSVLLRQVTLFCVTPSIYELSHSLSPSSWLTTPTMLQDLLDHIQVIIRLNSWNIKGYNGKRKVTYSEINPVLLLKTPGGSSFIWLLPNSLSEDIPWFQLKVLFFRNCCYRRFFISFFLLDWQFYLCRARIKHTPML